MIWQVSKTLFGEYVAAKKRNKPFKGLGLEHVNLPCPVVPSQLTSSAMRSVNFQVMINFLMMLVLLFIETTWSNMF